VQGWHVLSSNEGKRASLYAVTLMFSQRNDMLHQTHEGPQDRGEANINVGHQKKRGKLAY